MASFWDSNGAAAAVRNTSESKTLHHNQITHMSQNNGQLDFYEAMSDFQTMFPRMDSEVIETVLRSNQGSVDATIDHLLKMSTVYEKQNSLSAAPNHKVGIENLPRMPKQPNLPPSYEQAVGLKASTISDADSLVISTNVPPPFNSFDGHDLTHRKHLHEDGQASSLVRRPFHSMAAADNFHFSQHSPLISMGPPVNAYRHWNPPLLGTLPKDFLRLIPPTKRQRDMISHNNGSIAAGNDAVERFSGCHHHRCRNCGRRHASEQGFEVRRSASEKAIDPVAASAAVANFQHAGVIESTHHRQHHTHAHHQQRDVTAFSATSCSPRRHDQRSPVVAVSAPVSNNGCMLHHKSRHGKLQQQQQQQVQRPSEADEEILEQPISTASSWHAVEERLSGHDVPSLLQWRLAANKKARGSVDASMNPIQAQSLSDERLAIILQNQEFLKWLRHDRDFMHTLRNDALVQEDSSDNNFAHSFQEQNSSSGVICKVRNQPSSAATSAAAAGSDTFSNDSHLMPFRSLSLSDKPRNNQAMYGEDRETRWWETSDCSQEIHDNSADFCSRHNDADEDDEEDDDDELRHRLKNMGKHSRKKFVDLAKRFFSVRYKKKSNLSSLPFYKSDAPTESMVNLLEEDESEKRNRELTAAEESDLQALANNVYIEPLPAVITSNNYS